MADQRVKVTVRDWATECAMADAQDMLDSPYRGVVAVENAQSPVVYQFSNGRRFRDSKKKPGVD
jgi:hypothetical protein